MPTSASVNIDTGGNQMDWMDINADAEWHGKSMRSRKLANIIGCVETEIDDDDVDPGTGGGRQRRYMTVRLADQLSRKLLSLRLRLGCFSFLRALASI